MAWRIALGGSSAIRRWQAIPGIERGASGDEATARFTGCGLGYAWTLAHLASVNGQMRLVDASGKPYVFGTTEVHADIPLYAGEGWWKAVHAAGKAGEAAVRAIADIGEKQAIKLADGSTRFRMV